MKWRNILDTDYDSYVETFESERLNYRVFLQIIFENRQFEVLTFT